MTDQSTLRSELSGNSSEPTADIWRKEIHARVNGYRTRRGRRIEGAYTMRFPFPPPETEVAAPVVVVPEEPVDQEPIPESKMASAAEISTNAVKKSELCDQEPGLAAAKLEVSLAEVVSAEISNGKVLPAESPAPPEILPDPEPPRIHTPRPRPQRKVIAFPRQAASTRETVHRLADPVLPEQPRILDVPEELEAFPTTPFLDGLQFGPHTQTPVAAHADNVELPFRAVGRGRRLYAGLLDGLLVAAGAAVCAAVGHRMLPGLVLTKPVLLTLAGLPVLLWAAYQYLLLVYGGATAGMRVAKIRLSTFKGKSPRPRERRNRVLALYFSTASVIMGLLWAFVDVDALCWHDRISRTYLTPRE